MSVELIGCVISGVAAVPTVLPVNHSSLRARWPSLDIDLPADHGCTHGRSCSRLDIDLPIDLPVWRCLSARQERRGGQRRSAVYFTPRRRLRSCGGGPST